MRQGPEGFTLLKVSFPQSKEESWKDIEIFHKRLGMTYGNQKTLYYFRKGINELYKNILKKYVGGVWHVGS